MPDYELGVLQNRFRAKELESLYQRYEQRLQLSELFDIVLSLTVIISQVTSQYSCSYSV